MYVRTPLVRVGNAKGERVGERAHAPQRGELRQVLKGEVEMRDDSNASAAWVVLIIIAVIIIVAGVNLDVWAAIDAATP